jgi:hypothetical protein
MMLLEALEKEGGVKYLRRQAKKHPQAFMTLLGKIIPTQVVGDMSYRYVAEMPPPETDPEEWLKRYSPKPTHAAPDDQAIVAWRPRSAPQAAYITCPVFEIFYGGARGSLKTEGTLGDWLNHSHKYGEDAVGLMVRRTREQLKETFERAKRLYVPLGFHPAGHTITSPQGARLRFAYLERDEHAENYQGDNNTRVYVEELGNFPNPAPVMKLMATLRSTKGVHVGFRGTGNPGGPGHGWVKARYITPAREGWKIVEEPFINPWTGEKVMKQRIFIPGKITDHNLLGADYIANLQMSGSPELVRAWLEGDWDVVAGAYFPEFSRGRHVLEPTEFPADWRRFTASDWGSARPFWTGWFVVVQKEMKARTVTGRPVCSCPARSCATASGTARIRAGLARTSVSSCRSRSGLPACSSARAARRSRTTWSTPRCSMRTAARRSPSAR